jgi:hypothetical protein
MASNLGIGQPGGVDALPAGKAQALLGVPPSMQADFAPDDCRVVPQADPSMVTDQQRIAKGQVISELCAHPVLGPHLNAEQALRRVLTNVAIDNMDELIQPADPAAAQAGAAAQAAKIRELEAKIEQLTADAGLKTMQAEKVRADIVATGAKISHDAEVLVRGDTLAEREYSDEQAAAQHERDLAILNHHVGREDADRAHMVELMRLTAGPQQPDAAGDG